MGHLQAQSREVMIPYEVKSYDLMRRGKKDRKQKIEYLVDHIIRQKNLTKSIEPNSVLRVNFK